MSRSRDEHRTIWAAYNESARQRDKYLLKDWNDGIQNLLLFSGIFAAAVTALCVETRKLLEEDKEDTMKTILLSMAAKMDNASLSAVPNIPAFTPEPWAKEVNACFFGSLTASLVAALGGVICLQWVGEYDNGLEMLGDCKDQALQRHFRFRAAKKWLMIHIIAALHLLLFVAVVAFLIGLVIWFWITYPPLSSIPLIGLIIWSVCYVLTTTLAAVWPSAPYRTTVSRGLFRLFAITDFWVRRIASALHCSVRVVSTVPRETWKNPMKALQLIRANYWFEQGMAIQEFLRIKTEGYPWHPAWMTNSKHYWKAMHSNLWELGNVRRDKALPLSTLAWLGRTFGRTEQMREDTVLLLKELNRLQPDQLNKWRLSVYDAPWMEIFNFVLSTPAGSTPTNDDTIRQTVVELMQKMSKEPRLFERMVIEMDPRLVELFLRQLASDLFADRRPNFQMLEETDYTRGESPEDPMEEPKNGVLQKAWATLRTLGATFCTCKAPHQRLSHKDKANQKRAAKNNRNWDDWRSSIQTEAKKRLMSLKALLASDAWEKLKHTSQPTNLMLTLIFDCLEQRDGENAIDISTLWLFTLCTRRAERPEVDRTIEDASWSWLNRQGRIQAVTDYICFVDATLSNGTLDSSRGWRWTLPSNEPSDMLVQASNMLRDEPGGVMVLLLISHILRIQVQVCSLYSPTEEEYRAFFVKLFPETIVHPALKLISSAIRGCTDDIAKYMPDLKSPLWQSAVWKLAVGFWCGLRPGWGTTDLPNEMIPPTLPPSALSMFRAITRWDDADLNKAALQLIYSNAQYLKCEDWIEIFGHLFRFGVAGRPMKMTTQLLRMITLVPVVQASPIQKLRLIINERIIVPNHARQRFLLQGQGQSRPPPTAIDVQGRHRSADLMDPQTTMREVIELMKRFKADDHPERYIWRAPFKMHDLLNEIQQNISQDIMNMDLSQLRVCHTLTAQAARHFHPRMRKRGRNLATAPAEEARTEERLRLPSAKRQSFASHAMTRIRSLSTTAIVPALPEDPEMQAMKTLFQQFIAIRRCFLDLREDLRCRRKPGMILPLGADTSATAATDATNDPSIDPPHETVESIIRLPETRWKKWMTLLACRWGEQYSIPGKDIAEDEEESELRKCREDVNNAMKTASVDDETKPSSRKGTLEAAVIQPTLNTVPSTPIESRIAARPGSSSGMPETFEEGAMGQKQDGGVTNDEEVKDSPAVLPAHRMRGKSRVAKAASKVHFGLPSEE